MFKKNKQPDFALKFSLWTVFACFIIFALARLTLLLLYGNFFADLSAAQITKAFVQGLRFDGSVIALFVGIPLFLLNIPLKSRLWVKLWSFCAIISAMVVTGFLIGDIIYFPNVNRHITDELIYIGNDLPFLIKYILFKTPLQLALLLAGGGWFLYYIGGRINKYYQPAPIRWSREILKLFLILVFILLGIRGHLGKDKPIGVADVYKYADTPAAATLTLNGAFTTYQITRKGGVHTVNNYPLDKALQNTQAALLTPDEKVLNPQYPLMRQIARAENLTGINVLIVMLEGWSPYYIDSLSGNNFGVTPVFDGIVKDGAVFTNGYAVGTRSIFGFASILASLPMTPGLPIFGYGTELNEITPSMKLFADRGYYTFYAQTSLRHSYRMCALAKFLGAQEQYGWEDIPQQLPHLEKAPFGYDYDLMMFAADKIKARSRKNFFAMLFTGITHDPFVKTLERFDIYKGGTKEDGFKNSLAYADWSIGELLARAKKEGWFDNTVFVFASDHTNHYNGTAKTIKENFNIPFVFYAPKILKAGKYDIVVSQTDIMPTLYKMAGINAPYTAFGKDIFDEAPQPRYAFVYEGTSIGLITKDGAMSHSRTEVLSQEPFTKDFDAQKTQDVLLSFDKAATTLLQTNKWFKNEK